MSTAITVVHVITCFLLVVVILMQSGKGAEISASLAGSSNTIFGSSGGANIFVRITQVLAAVFMATSLSLTYIGNGGRQSVFDGTTAPGAPTTQQAPPVETAPASAPAGQAPAKK